MVLDRDPDSPTRGFCVDRSTQAPSTATVKQEICNHLVFPLRIWGQPKARPVLLLHGFPQESSTWYGGGKQILRARKFHRCQKVITSCWRHLRPRCWSLCGNTYGRP